MSKHTPTVALTGQATREELAAFADRLRALAQFLEDTDAPVMHDALVVDLTAVHGSNLSDDDRRIFESRPRALVRSIAGRVDKKMLGETMRLERRFDDDLPEYAWQGTVRIRWVLDREKVCVATPTGETKTVKRYGQYTDAAAAKALHAALDALAVTETVPIVEYDCKPILGADEPAEAAA